MIVTAFDPAYRTLGSARLRIEGERVELLDTEIGGLEEGVDIAPERFVEVFQDYLEERIAGSDAVCSEALPEGFKRGKKGRRCRCGATVWIDDVTGAPTIGRMGVVVGILTAAARRQGIPFSTIRALDLKHAAGIPTKWPKGWDRRRRRAASKAFVVEKVQGLFPSFSGTDHEADAVLVGLARHAPQALSARFQEQ